MKRILSILALTALSFIGYSQCGISISIAPPTANVGDTINAWGTGNTSNNGYFAWSVTGGTPSTGATFDTLSSFTTQFLAPGTYSICAVWYDSLWACQDSACSWITITSGSTIDSVSASDGEATTRTTRA